MRAALAVGFAALALFCSTARAEEGPEEYCLRLVSPVDRIACYAKTDGTFSAAARGFTFQVSVTGGRRPIISVATNLYDGTAISMILGTPYSEDWQFRLAAGKAACDPDCFDARGPQFDLVVRGGQFSNGPYLHSGRPLASGSYPLQIFLSADATGLASRRPLVPVYRTEIVIPP